MDKLIYGSIYRQFVAFDDEKGGKFRPVFVLFTDSDDVYFYSISTKAGEKHQKRYRPPILNWRRCGLKRPSFIMIDDPPYILSKNQFTDDKHLGQTAEIDIEMLEIHMQALGL